MSAYVKYDPDLFKLYRVTSVSSSLDEFLIGVSVLAPGPTTKVLIDAATVSITSGYSPDDNGTLLVDAETASIDLSFWDTPGELLYPADRIEVRYSGELIFWGTVTGTSLAYAVDPDAARHGAVRRVTFSATVAGVYAVVMSRIVTWKKLPIDEKAIVRIRRWVTVNNWED